MQGLRLRCKNKKEDKRNNSDFFFSLKKNKGFPKHTKKLCFIFDKHVTECDFKLRFELRFTVL